MAENNSNAEKQEQPVNVSSCGSMKLIDIHANNLYSSVLLADMHGKLREELHEMLWCRLYECYQLGYRQGVRDRDSVKP